MDAKRRTTIARDQSDDLQTFDVRCWALDVGRLLHFPFSRLSSAFTLIELIVVVAVIALLIALLLPNIRMAREKAWSSTCQNNLKQYGMALNQYLISYASASAAAGGGSAGTYGIAADGTRISPGDPGTMVTVGGGTLDSGSYVSGGIGRDGASGGSSSSEQSYLYSILNNLPSDVTMQSLSDGKASIRVCPAVLRQIQAEGNFFDPSSPNYKGDHVSSATDPFVYADFQGGLTIVTNLIESELEGITNVELTVEGEPILAAFTTYAPNPYMSASSPQNVIAFIDWNAEEGWGAYLAYTNWMFNSPDGSIVQDVTPKWTNAWWLTEVGFNHPLDNEYGANYVAMDGHVGWISSNDITLASFTNSVGP